MALAVTLSKKVPETTLCTRFKVRGDVAVMDSKDAQRCQSVRAVFCSRLAQLPLNRNQLDCLTSWLGEAMPNAVEHSIKGSFVAALLVYGDRHILISFVNTSNGYCGEPPKPDCWGEKGRGRYIMEGMIEELQRSGLAAEQRYRYIPDRRSGAGRTVVSLSLTL